MLDCPKGARRKLLPTCLTALAAAACLAAAAPSHAAAQNAIRYIQPVISRTHVVTYNICLYSTTEFPMRDEVITLAIGNESFINSSYVQGGDLHTIIFSLTQSQYLSLKNGDPVVIYYGQGDASIPAAQWNFGRLRSVVASATPSPIVTPVKPQAAVSARTTTQRGKK